MRVVTLSILSGLLLSTLAIADGIALAAFDGFAPDSSTTLANYQSDRGRNTSYRGSGRREIMAFPVTAHSQSMVG